jgi:integrase
MARLINRLASNAVKRLKVFKRHADGGGLYLSISANGGRRWVFLYRWRGKKTEIGLGSARDVPLARARELATNARGKLAEGVNPKDSARQSKTVPTFGEAARKFIESMRPSWKKTETGKDQKHADQWQMTLMGTDKNGKPSKFDYCASLRGLPVDKITASDVCAVLSPIWLEKPDTARRTRGRIERVLGAAKARGERSGENPARLKDNLDGLLPSQKKSTGHYTALHYRRVPAFMNELSRNTETAETALSFTVQTVARSSEARLAKWAEFELRAEPVTLRDEAGKEFTNIGPLWTVPIVRMKGKRLHQVPLAPQVVAVLERMRATGHGVYVFAGPGDEPLAEGEFDRVLRAFKIKEDATTHGFRSSFRDWASEETNFDGNACEMALAHKVSDDVEAAYRRGALFEKRRHIMRAWSEYCAGTPAQRVAESLGFGLTVHADGTISSTVNG